MLKTPRAPVRGFTPQVRRATPGTAQHVAKDTASNGLKKSSGHRGVTFQSRGPRCPHSAWTTYLRGVATREAGCCAFFPVTGHRNPKGGGTVPAGVLAAPSDICRPGLKFESR